MNFRGGAMRTYQVYKLFAGVAPTRHWIILYVLVDFVSVAAKPSRIPPLKTCLLNGKVAKYHTKDGLSFSSKLTYKALRVEMHNNFSIERVSFTDLSAHASHITSHRTIHPRGRDTRTIPHTSKPCRLFLKCEGLGVANVDHVSVHSICTDVH